MIFDGFLVILDLSRLTDYPVHYIVHVYLLFFGLVSCMTELDPNFVPKTIHAPLEGFQHKLHDYAKALTMLWGRGIFYIFVGALMISQTPDDFDFDDLLSADNLCQLIGFYAIICGVLCGLLHWRNHKSLQPHSAAQGDYISIGPGPSVRT